MQALTCDAKVAEGCANTRWRNTQHRSAHQCVVVGVVVFGCAEVVMGRSSLYAAVRWVAPATRMEASSPSIASSGANVASLMGLFGGWVLYAHHVCTPSYAQAAIPADVVLYKQVDMCGCKHQGMLVICLCIGCSAYNGFKVASCVVNKD